MAWINQIKKEISGLDMSVKSLRNFGLIVGGVFVLLGFLFFPFLDAIFNALTILGGTLILLGVSAPKLLLRPYLIWMSLAVVLGFFVFRILLVVIFVFVIIPAGLFMKLTSSNKNNNSETYWIKHE